MGGQLERDEPILGTRRGMSLGQRIAAPDSYGVLIVLILGSLIAMAAAGESAAGRVVAVVLQGGVLLYALWTARAGARLFRVSLVLVPAIVVVAGVLTGGESDASVAVVSVASTVLAAGAIGMIVRRIGAHPRVDAATILGALCTYLLIGTFFSSLYASVEAIGEAPFFVQDAAPQLIDFVYFSFVTMSTVGYGDFTAATDLGRMLAVTEALTGQLYLVTVVALVIGNIGRERSARRASGAEPEREESLDR